MFSYGDWLEGVKMVATVGAAAFKLLGRIAIGVVACPFPCKNSIPKTNKLEAIKYKFLSRGG